MDFERMKSDYIVRELDEKNVDEILELYRGNPLYFKYCSPAPTVESVRRDMESLPSGCTYDVKHFLGFYNNDNLIAVLDIIAPFSYESTAWLGIFMVEAKEQGKGVGSGIVQSLISHLKTKSYKKVGLAYVKGNTQAERFWEKNGFIPTGREVKRELFTVVMTERRL